jgi:hypothetical protein
MPGHTSEERWEESKHLFETPGYLYKRAEVTEERFIALSPWNQRKAINEATSFLADEETKREDELERAAQQAAEERSPRPGGLERGKVAQLIHRALMASSESQQVRAEITREHIDTFSDETKAELAGALSFLWGTLKDHPKLLEVIFPFLVDRKDVQTFVADTSSFLRDIYGDTPGVFEVLRDIDFGPTDPGAEMFAAEREQRILEEEREASLVEMRAERIEGQPQAFLDVSAAEVAAGTIEETERTGEFAGTEIQQVRQAEEFVQAEMFAAVEFFLRKRSAKISPTMAMWMSTTEGVLFLIDRAALDQDVIDLVKGTDDWLAEMFAADRLTTFFGEWADSGGGVDTRRAIELGKQGVLEPTSEGARLVSALWEHIYTGQLQDLQKKIPPAVFMWLDSDVGKSKTLDHYFNNLTAFGVDAFWPDLDILSFSVGLDENKLTALWEDTNPVLAAEAAVDLLLEGRSKDEREQLKPVILQILQEDFDVQFLQKGGTSSYSQFLADIDLSRITRQIDAASFVQQRTVGGGDPNVSLISPEFFNQTFGSLYQQAADNLKESTGKEPTFDEVSREAANIQDAQLQSLQREARAKRFANLDPATIERARVSLRESTGAEPTEDQVATSLGFGQQVTAGEPTPRPTPEPTRAFIRRPRPFGPALAVRR